MTALVVGVIAAALAQGAALAVDEAWFHRRRGLPRWERLGHPIDTLSAALAVGWLAIAAPSPHQLAIAIALALASCLVITKDEWVHARACAPGEHWLHAILFVLHPIVFACFAALWWQHVTTPIEIQLALTITFGAYQVTYWRSRPA